MKRILTLLVLFAAVLQLEAQSPERRPLWFGLNMGGTWQTSDMKALGGIGWGFTISRYTRIQSPSPVFLGWRFRFLDGRNYGYNYHRLTGLQANPTLSSGATNYAAPANGGSVYSNYKMRFDEFAFELMLGSNSLRKHGVLLYAFGGAGLNYWRSETNQLNGTELYNYSTITGDGSDDIVRGQLDMMWDDTYETTVQSGKWSFMPSAGIGMGYQWGNGFAIGVEHRTTWALNDMIDGLAHNGEGQPTLGNDLYHYDGLFIRWTFGGGKSSTSTTNNPPPPPPNPNTYTQNPQNPPPPPNNTVVTNPPPPDNNTHNTPPLYPPTVRFTTPATEPYTATTVNQQLVVRVQHVVSSNQISLLINNQPSTNFTYNASTDQMVFNHTLLPGTNVYQVTASNNAGTASDVQTIIFKSGTNPPPPPPANPLPPTVTITNPPTDPYTSTTATMNVAATVLNVTSASNIQVRRNGNAITNFSFDPNTHVLTFVANLQTGSNLYEVVGTNTVGSASDVVTINYNPVAQVQPPVVTITSPANCPYSSKTANLTITANITNITTASQAAIVFNNQAVTNFNFVGHGSFATVSFPVTMNPGQNNVTITGTNTAGSNSKSCTITFKVTTQPTGVPPTVTITSPSTNPYNAPTQNVTVNATVQNVNSQNEITVTKNNAVVTGWVYNMTTKLLSLPTTLNVGSNVFTVTASNSNGSDSKSTTINYSPMPAVQPPVVTITTPSSNPFITNNQGVAVVATVLNVTQSSQITVTTLTGAGISFQFNANTHLVTFTPTLVAGANQFTVTATNTAGTASDNTTIKLVSTSTGTTTGGTTGGSTTTTAPGGTRPGTTTGNVPPPPPPPPPAGGGSGSTGSVTVTILDPPNANVTTTSSAITVTARFTAVATTGEITVLVNNAQQTGLSYSPITGNLTFTANLVSGTNTIVVSATNSNGSASKTLTVTYNPGSRTGSTGKTGTSTGKTTTGKTSTGKTSSSTTTTTTKPEPKAEPKETGRPGSSGSSSSSGSAGGGTSTAPSTPRSGGSSTTTAPSRPR